MTSIGTMITVVNAVTRHTKRFMASKPLWLILANLGQCAVDRYRVSAQDDGDDPLDDGDGFGNRVKFGAWDCFIHTAMSARRR